MFENLTERMHQAFQHLRGRSHIKERHIRVALKEIHEALIDADVAVSVAADFIQALEEKALGQAVTQGLSPEQQLMKVVNDELVRVLGNENEAKLNFNTVPPAIFLIAGLQGSGKTTFTAKLGQWLRAKQNKKVMVVSVDIYRPAAIKQLEVLAQAASLRFFESHNQQNPLEIVKAAHLQAKKEAMDVLIVDTAGRLHIDEDMMNEIQALKQVLNPIETLFVVDSMTGQDAIKTAAAFDKALNISGTVLTKTDGDARGGAALSIRQVTGKPIKFMGTGEGIEALEPFYPDRLASRILGAGDILSFIETIEEKVDKAKAEKLAKKLEKGQGFDLEDLRNQMKEMMNIGVSGLIDKLPGVGGMAAALKAKANDKMNQKALIRTIAAIDSMTIRERRFPALVMNSASRKNRIAKGAGVNPQEILQVLKQHEQMQKMMKKLTNKGMMGRLMQGLQGQMPFPR